MSAPKKPTAAAGLRELRNRIKLLRQVLREHADYAGKLEEMAAKTSSEELRPLLSEEAFKAHAQMQGLMWAVKILDGTDVQVTRLLPPE